MLRVFEWLWESEKASRWSPWTLQAPSEIAIEGELLPTDETLSELNIISGTMLRLSQEQEEADATAAGAVPALVPAAETTGGAAASVHGDTPPLVVKWSTLNTVPSPVRACTEAWVYAGEGLFVAEAISAGGLIGNYRYVNGRDGRQLARLSRAEFKRKYPDGGDVPPTHVVEYEDSNYKKWYLDAKDEGVMGKANDARCEDRQTARRVGSSTRIVARRDLAAGDEVTWNYTTADGDRDAYKWNDNLEDYLLREVELMVGDDWQWWAGGLYEWKARARAAAAWDKWWKDCTTSEHASPRVDEDAARPWRDDRRGRAATLARLPSDKEVRWQRLREARRVEPSQRPARGDISLEQVRAEYAAAQAERAARLPSEEMESLMKRLADRAGRGGPIRAARKRPREAAQQAAAGGPQPGRGAPKLASRCRQRARPTSGGEAAGAISGAKRLRRAIGSGEERGVRVRKRERAGSESIGQVQVQVVRESDLPHVCVHEHEGHTHEHEPGPGPKRILRGASGP